MVYFHYFINEILPYNFSNFLINLKYLNFQFLPNPFALVVPASYSSPASLSTFSLAVQDSTFFISCGQYFVLLLFYLGWALLISLLKNRTLNKFVKLRRFAKGVYQRRIKYGVIH